MNMKKMIIGAVLVFGINHCYLIGGNMAPEWIEKLRHIGEDGKYVESFQYKGAYWLDWTTECKKGMKSKNPLIDPVVMKHTSRMAIYHGLYKLKIMGDKDKIRVESDRKIIITQKKPCFIANKYWDKTSISKKLNITKRKQHPYKKIEKLNSHSVVVYDYGASNMQNTGISGELRKGLRERIYKNGKYFVDVTPKIIDSSNSKIILGDSFDCLKEANEETWEVYWKLRGDWVLMAKEKFYISGNSLNYSDKITKVNTVQKKYIQPKPLSKHTSVSKIVVRPMINDKKPNDVKPIKLKKKDSARIRIYQYGSPAGVGKTLDSMSECKIERDKLTKANAGTDYSYKCEKL